MGGYGAYVMSSLKIRCGGVTMHLTESRASIYFNHKAVSRDLTL